MRNDAEFAEKPDDCSPQGRVSKHGVLLFLVPLMLLLVVAFSINFQALPRFDETGYAILAKSLAEGHGYREIDQPGSPRHAHFPPGWPAALALGWLASGNNVELQSTVAHGLVVLAWIVSVQLWYLWYRKTLPEISFMLVICLSMNWLWIRMAGELKSETLYIVLSIAALLSANLMMHKGYDSLAIMTGAVTGLSILTRQVGITLLAALLIELILKRQWRKAVFAGMTSGLVLLPWLIWQVVAGGATQAGLLVDDQQKRSMIRRIFDQAIFYMERLPDSVMGPYVEMATVFQSNPVITWVARAASFLFCIVLVIGLRDLGRREESRLAVRYFCVSIFVLILWPFTEAGRFLIPLVPVTLAGFATGLNVLMRNCYLWQDLQAKKKIKAEWLIVAMVLPFGIYTLQKSWKGEANLGDSGFDQACLWMRENLGTEGVIASRHPGDVFWRTNHQGVSWPDAKELQSAYEKLRERNVRFVFVDENRFVGASIPEWLRIDQIGKSEHFREIEMGEGKLQGVRLYRVIDR